MAKNRLVNACGKRLYFHCQLLPVQCNYGYIGGFPQVAFLPTYSLAKLDGPNLVQGVFSIPLGAGAARAPGLGMREKTLRSTVLDEFIAGRRSE